METPEKETVTGEIVQPDTSLVRTQSVTIEELANDEQGLEKIERGIAIMKTLRAASIALTFPHDWVLFKAEDRVTGYLQESGCQRMKDLWGIEVYDIGDWIRAELPDTGDFSWSISANGLSKRTGQVILGVAGTRYSYEDFITKRKLNKLQIETEVKKAARANLDGNIARELSGMKSVPVEELDQVWNKAEMGAYKTSKLCPRGRGFGSQAERQGAQVQQSDDLKPGEEPLCPQCEANDKPVKMKFVQAGTSRTSGKSYDAFWSCPIQNSGHKTVAHSDHMKVVESRRKAAE